MTVTDTDGMANIVYLYGLPWVTREGWGEGEWDSEPDRVQWEDTNTGYECIVRRGRLGQWNGYVGVPVGSMDLIKGHASEDFQDHVHSKIYPHGGVTYAEECDGDNLYGISRRHPDGPTLMWLGFDCIHFGDFAPGMEAVLPPPEYEDEWLKHYWTLNEAVAETKELAQQIYEAE